MLMVKNESSIHIYWWMLNDLNLSWNDLIVYATIFSFTNWTDDHCYHGSASYLGEWCWLQRRQIMNILKSLEEKWLIIRKERNINGVKFVDYYTGYANIAQGDMQILHEGGYANIAHHNNRVIDKNREDNNYTRQNEVLTEKEKKFEEFWRLYPKKRKKNEARKKFIKINDLEIEKVMSWLNRYLDYWRKKWTEMQYIPDPTTWINQERRNDEIEDWRVQKKFEYNTMPDVSKMSIDELKAFTWLK